MASLRVLSAMALVVSLFVTNLRAEDPTPYKAPKSSVPVDADDDAPNSIPPTFELIQPRLGRGYIPYSYPVFDSCHCASNGCFHPSWYYCGGKEYRRQWFRKWAKAHLGRGSMLDDYPCHCIYPTTGRPYLRSTSVSDSSSNATVPPIPSDFSPR